MSPIYEPSPGDAVRVRGFRGVAFTYRGPPKVWETYTTLCYGPDGATWEEDTGEGEWVEDTDSDRALVVMAGDDRKMEVDLDQLNPLAEGEYCGSCGQ